MIYGAILAGGNGNRMRSNIPKQFLEIDGIPMIIITLKKMLRIADFDIIYIAVHSDWKIHLTNLLTTYAIKSSKIRVISGGKERLNTIENVITATISEFGLNEEDIIVVHESVRPFVSIDTLKSSVNAAQKYGAVVAAVPAIDTMLYLDGEGFVTSIPDRTKLYHGQAPDSFKLALLKTALEKLSPEDRVHVTGTAQICLLSGIPVHIISGDYRNIKITTKSDLQIAEILLKQDGELE